MNKAKAFNNQFTSITYCRDKINNHIDFGIKNLPTEEILLITPQMQLVISNSTNNNSIGPDGPNIRQLKHLRSLAIKYLTNMYNTALKSQKALTIQGSITW